MFSYQAVALSGSAAKAATSPRRLPISISVRTATCMRSIVRRRAVFQSAPTRGGRATGWFQGFIDYRCGVENQWPEPVERVAAYLRAAGAEARLEEFAASTPTAEAAARAAGCET